jgi:hypothetical protein
MNVIATTRFNTETWIENKRWRERNEYNGCIYGTPSPMCQKIILESNVFVLEMHNDENRIKGVGMVTNILNMKKHYNIYSNKNYNRYTYKSEYRIDRDEMSWLEIAYIHMLEKFLFKTKGHLKRGSGITSIPKKMMDNIKIIEIDVNFVSIFKKMFSLRFQNLHL